MSYVTYFEIGGHVVETYVDRPGIPPRPVLDPLPGISRKTGIPTKLLREGSRSVERDTGLDLAKLGKKYQRAKRARWAITTAGTLAAADGPVPIGDALAMGFLALYGAYEVVQIFTD